VTLRFVTLELIIFKEKTQNLISKLIPFIIN